MSMPSMLGTTNRVRSSENIIELYYIYIYISLFANTYVPVASFDSAEVPPRMVMGRTMEGRGHSLHDVGNSFMSRHHKER